MAENNSDAAVKLGRMRWAGVSEAERAEHGRMMAAKRWAKRRKPTPKKPLTS